MPIRWLENAIFIILKVIEGPIAEKYRHCVITVIVMRSKDPSNWIVTKDEIFFPYFLY
jgi:hypothetical protein